MRYLITILTILFIATLSSEAQKKESNDSTKKSSFAIYPAFGSQPETGAQLGTIAIWVFKARDNENQEFQRQTSISPFFLYTLKNQVISAFDTDAYFKNGLNLTSTVRYFNFPDNYYGIGNSNDPDSLEKYTNNFFQIVGTLYRPINPKVFVGLTYELQRNWLRDIEPEGRIITENITGQDGGFFLGVGPAVKYDSRDNTIFPSKGIFAFANILAVQIGDYRYTAYTLEARKFFTIANEKNIIGIHFSSRFTSGKNVPFYKLPQLGGDERLRGIENASIYRDKQSIFLQTEYRRDLFWRFGMVAFAGIGDVAKNPGDFRLDEFKYIAGLGLRFAAVKGQKLNIRTDFGIARGGQTAFYIGLKEVF